MDPVPNRNWDLYFHPLKKLWKSFQLCFRVQPSTTKICQTAFIVSLQKSGAVHIFLLLGTCDSFSPKLMASFFRSILLIYFCFWNIFSRAFLWSSEKTALLKIPLRALELESCVRRGSTLSSPREGRKIQSPVNFSGEASLSFPFCVLLVYTLAKLPSLWTELMQSRAAFGCWLC